MAGKNVKTNKRAAKVANVGKVNMRKGGKKGTRKSRAKK